MITVPTSPKKAIIETVTLSSNGPVEVGSTVTISPLTAGAATAGSRIVTCTCSQGYFEADADGNATGSHKTGNKSISVAASVSGDAALACTWNGTACDASAELIVVEGTNTVKADVPGANAYLVQFGANETKNIVINNINYEE